MNILKQIVLTFYRNIKQITPICNIPLFFMSKTFRTAPYLLSLLSYYLIPFFCISFYFQHFLVNLQSVHTK